MALIKKSILREEESVTWAAIKHGAIVFADELASLWHAQFSMKDDADLQTQAHNIRTKETINSRWYHAKNFKKRDTNVKTLAP